MFFYFYLFKSATGRLQEEILFSIKPECLVSMLICEKLEANECIMINGAERFSDYSGYGFDFTWKGDYIDNSERDDNGNILTKIGCIDAVPYFNKNFTALQKFERDLNKAYCAFQTNQDDKELSVATGNWGYF